MWHHDFVCIAKTNQTKTPTSIEVGRLISAGIGKKHFSIYEDGDASDLHEQILKSFPPLAKAGGYELLRVGDQPGRRCDLEIIPVPPKGYTATYLKEVVRQAKVYIRPLQQNLSLDPLIVDAVSHAVFLFSLLLV